MSYIITGPTTIGTTGQLNEILGDMRLTDIGTARGTILFAGALGPGNLEGLPPSTAGFVLQTNGPGADPTWVSNGASANANGFSAGKVAGDTFVNIVIPIQNWSVASPTVGLSGNPFFNTGPDFVPATGVYTAPIDGAYMVDAYIEYSNTSPAHGSLKTLTFVETTSTPANGIIVSCGPRQGSGNVLSTEVLHIHQIVKLVAGAGYALQIEASDSSVTNTILASSRFSIVFQSL